MFRILLFIFLGLFSSLKGKIIETDHFRQIKDYLCEDTLVILDVDDTLLIPVQTLGTDVWFTERLKNYSKLYEDQIQALDKALAEWEAVRHITHVKIVETGTDEIIKELQNENITVMGLTTQGLALATRTVNQLKSLNIDLSKTAPSKEDHYYINGVQGVLFRKGLLFTAGSDKGDALLKLLQQLQYCPKHILFINDKKTHLKDVEKSLELKGIPFTGLRYTFSDERVNNYDPKLAEFEWNHSTFTHLLSDDEARRMMH